MFQTINGLQRYICPPLSKSILRMMVMLTVAALMIVPVVGPAYAAPSAQTNNNACKYDGILILPKVDAAHTYGWGFVANFDHTASSTTVTTCLAERFYGQAPWQTTYTVAQHCTVMNNAAVPPMQFGNGVAPFDGNAYLSCTLPVPKTYPDLFWIRARASLPNASQSYTFLAGTVVGGSVAVRAQTDPACGLTLTSQYPGLTFSTAASPACGSFTEVGSRVTPKSSMTQNGWHQIGTTIYGPTAGTGNLVVPANFSFNIGAVGQPYTLDWLVIDPVPSRCCSPN